MKCPVTFVRRNNESEHLEIKYQASFEDMISFFQNIQGESIIMSLSPHVIAETL